MKRVLMGLVVVALAFTSQVAAQQTPAGDESAEASPALTVTVKLGTAIEDRELADESTTFQVGQVAYLWMRAEGGPSDPVTVTWKLGEHSYDVELAIGGPRWRTWSSKTLWKAGDWSAEVRDANGASLYSVDFSVVSAMDPPASEQP